MAPQGFDLATNAQNLGSPVLDWQIAGKIETDEGALGGQAVAIVPLKLLLAG